MSKQLYDEMVKAHEDRMNQEYVKLMEDYKRIIENDIRELTQRREIQNKIRPKSPIYELQREEEEIEKQEKILKEEQEQYIIDKEKLRVDMKELRETQLKPNLKVKK